MVLNKTKKRALIIGANGFIGGSLFEYFIKKKREIEIFGLDRNIQKGVPRIFKCDLGKKSDLKRVLLKVKPDIIFHCAGGRSDNSAAMLKSNVAMTKCLLDVACDLFGKNVRIIIPGTAAEYGKVSTRKPIKETDKPGLLSNYGYSKSKQTKLSLSYSNKGMDIIIARIFNVMGKNVPDVLSVGRFSRDIVSIEKGKVEPVLHTGDLRGKRDFLDIEDVCRALIRLANRGKAGEIYNVCSGKMFSMRMILKGLISLSSAKSIKIKESKSEFSKSFDIVGSNIKIKFCTGWIPKISLEKSLARSLKSYRKALK